MALSMNLTLLSGWRAHINPVKRPMKTSKKVQNKLFHLGADLATPLDAKADWVVRMDADSVSWLETSIDAMTVDLPALKQFILPGGNAGISAIAGRPYSVPTCRTGCTGVKC